MPTAVSTVLAPPPLALFWTATSNTSYELTARSYSGEPVGTLTIPYSDYGFEVAPDGSKVLDGDQITGANGAAIARISWTFPTLPAWADDSSHLCGVTYDPSPGGRASLVEFDLSGVPRTVALLGESGPNASWKVIACSPSADRVVVVDQGEPVETIAVLRLSTGASIASHLVADASWGTPAASHDGRTIAVNEASGISVREGSTWAVRAHIVRWGSQAGYPLIGAAIAMSWDGSRILIDGGGASGADHPEWLVDWVHDVDVLQPNAKSPHASFPVGAYDIIPLTQGASFLIGAGTGPETFYLLRDDGTLEVVTG